MTDAELIEAFWKLRDEQKRWFGTKAPDALTAAKAMERAVDAERERRERPKGRSLFDSIDEWDEKPTERQQRAIIE